MQRLKYISICTVHLNLIIYRMELKRMIKVRAQFNELTRVEGAERCNFGGKIIEEFSWKVLLRRVPWDYCPELM